MLVCGLTNPSCYVDERQLQDHCWPYAGDVHALRHRSGAIGDFVHSPAAGGLCRRTPGVATGPYRNRPIDILYVADRSIDILYTLLQNLCRRIVRQRLICSKGRSTF